LKKKRRRGDREKKERIMLFEFIVKIQLQI
jgi:hypothetical protein